MPELSRILGPISYLTAGEIAVSFLAAFVLSSAIAYVYRFTHRGFSYSRAFVQAQILGALVSAMIIMAIGNNLARGLGLLGALAIVRFRTLIRDTRDMMFIFAGLGVGVATGAQAFSVAFLGTAFFCAAALYLHWAPFASRREFDGLLTFLAGPGHSPERVRALLSEHCAACSLAAAREASQGEKVEFVYQVRVADSSRQSALIEALRRLDGISDVTLVIQRSTIEQ